MFTRKTVILDLGASRTALGRFSLIHGRLRLDELVVEIFPSQAVGESDWLQQTRTALAALRTRTNVWDPVVLVLPPHLTLTKLIRMPRIDPAKRGKILRFEAEQSLPYAPTDMVWDTVVAAESEEELEMLLAAAKREPLEALCATVQAAGFEPRLVVPSCQATLAAFRLVCGVPKEPVIVLNLGARSTLLLQVTDRRFTARSLALGTRHIMRDTAEQQDHVALEVIVTRLAQEITRSVLYFRRQGGAEDPTRIHLTGGGARLSGLGEALAAKIKVPVDRLDLSASLEIGGSVDQDAATGHGLIFTDLFGAAAMQLRQGQPMLNLLPPSLHQRAGRRRVWLAAATLAVAAAAWPLTSPLSPKARSGRPAAVIRHAPEPRAAEVPAPPPAVSQPDEEARFDWELLEVKAAPFPLHLAGYFGEPGDYLVVFISAGQPETLLVRRGHRFEQLGLTLRHFEVGKIAVDHDDEWPVFEAAGFAVLHDQRTDEEVVLDSRRKPVVTLQAVLQGAGDQKPLTRQAGEVIEQRGVSYRIQRIRVDPPEVVMVRQGDGPGKPEMRVLHPVRPTNSPGAASAGPETGLALNGG